MARAPLTKRERQIVARVARGRTNREIAAAIRLVVQGIQISTAPKAIDMALGVIEAVGA